MPHERRERKEICLWIKAETVPSCEYADGECVAEIVQVRIRDAQWNLKVQFGNQGVKSLADRAWVDGSSTT